MRRLIRYGIVIFSWSSLLLLLGTGMLMLYAGDYGWARQAVTTYRSDDGVHYDIVEYAITPTRIHRASATQILLNRYLDDVRKRARGRQPATGPAPGQVQHDVHLGFGPGPAASTTKPPPGHPDRTTGYPAIGVAADTRYREIRSGPDLWITFTSKTQYCWTLWPAIPLLALSFPALRQTLRALLYIRRARQNQKAHLRGICPGCGYDIRATPERCPECGRIQYAPDKERLSFIRRMTWLIGLGLLLPAIVLLGVGRLWELLQPDSYLRDGLFYPSMRYLLALYAVAILLWSVRHFILDLRNLVRVYGN